jgi:flagellar biosynthesis/type III secretory pathway M-ring protein FliF/YscJ
LQSPVFNSFSQVIYTLLEYTFSSDGRKGHVSGQNKEATAILAPFSTRNRSRWPGGLRPHRCQLVRSVSSIVKRGVMAEEKDSVKDDAEFREARAERLKHLLSERGEDAAKMVKTWLQQDQEKPK